MPKEIINSRYWGTQVTDQTTGKTVDLETTFVHVGWTGNHEHVEMATRQGGDWDETQTPRPGLFVQLDRAGVNRLIRVLRKARDQAFGADA